MSDPVTVADESRRLRLLGDILSAAADLAADCLDNQQPWHGVEPRHREIITDAVRAVSFTAKSVASVIDCHTAGRATLFDLDGTLADDLRVLADEADAVHGRVPAAAPVDASDVADWLRGTFPKMLAAAVVVQPGGGMPVVLIPLTAGVPEVLADVCERVAWVGDEAGGQV